MSTMQKRATYNRRTLSESSAEDISPEVENELKCSKSTWRNICLVETKRKYEDGKDSITEDSDTSIQNSQIKSSDIIDILIRIAIVLVFIKLELSSAFKREIHAEQLWLYKNPRRRDIVSPAELLISVILGPLFLTYIFYLFTKDKRDFRAASWAWTLALCMNAIPTTLLKITVGRPRPDFFYRCFPDGVMVLNETASMTSLGHTLLDFSCTGNPSEINEGRKSFPSGHSSFAFASFGFIAYYVGAKLHAFNAQGRGHTWRLAIAMTPLVVAGLVAVSRTCDYHHHWEDVTVGALIGLITGYASYRQYYPSVFAQDCHQPLMRWPMPKRNLYVQVESNLDGAGDGDDRPLLVNDQTN